MSETEETPQTPETGVKVLSAGAIFKDKKKANTLKSYLTDICTEIADCAFYITGQKQDGFTYDEIEKKVEEWITKLTGNYYIFRYIRDVDKKKQTDRKYGVLAIVSESEGSVFAPLTKAQYSIDELAIKVAKSLGKREIYAKWKYPYVYNGSNTVKSILDLFWKELGQTKKENKLHDATESNSERMEAILIRHIFTRMEEDNLYVIKGKNNTYMMCKWPELDFRPTLIGMSLKLWIDGVILEKGRDIAVLYTDKIIDLLERKYAFSHDLSLESREACRYIIHTSFTIQFADHYCNIRTGDKSDALYVRSSLEVPKLDMTMMTSHALSSPSLHTPFKFYYDTLWRYFEQQKKIGDKVFWRQIYRLIIGQSTDEPIPGFDRGENLFLISNPGGGKTKLREALCGFHDKVLIISDVEDSFKYADLRFNPSLIVFEEISGKDNISVLKKIWNCEDIAIRIKYKDNHTLKPTAPCVVSANSMQGLVKEDTDDLLALISRVSCYFLESEGDLLSELPDISMRAVALLAITLNQLNMKLGDKIDYKREWYEKYKELRIMNIRNMDYHLDLARSSSAEKQHRKKNLSDTNVSHVVKFAKRIVFSMICIYDSELRERRRELRTHLKSRLMTMDYNKVNEACGLEVSCKKMKSLFKNEMNEFKVHADKLFSEYDNISQRLMSLYDKYWTMINEKLDGYNTMDTNDFENIILGMENVFSMVAIDLFSLTSYVYNSESEDE